MKTMKPKSRVSVRELDVATLLGPATPSVERAPRSLPRAADTGSKTVGATEGLRPADPASPAALRRACDRHRDVVVADLSAVSDTDAIDRIADLERLINALQARQLLEIVAYATRRRRADLADGAPSDQAGRRATTEVALARRVSTATVDHQVALGNMAVVDHPRLTAAAMAGDISVAALRRVTDETCLLDAERRWLVDEQLAETLDKDTVCTPAQLAKAAAGERWPPTPTVRGSERTRPERVEESRSARCSTAWRRCRQSSRPSRRSRAGTHSTPTPAGCAAKGTIDR